MQLLCLGYPDRGSPGRKESGPTTAPIGGYAPGPISGPITDGEEKHPSSGTQLPITCFRLMSGSRLPACAERLVLARSVRCCRP